ncbi:MAG TPA: methyltransferase domain-containing protein [Syntrophobacteraceae bacterium]|nr:methyltransferase domain-containing protein [Syntrophobacteraceae bacterium]
MGEKHQNRRGYSDTSRYYDTMYYRNVTPDPGIPGHLKRLVSRIGIRKGQRVLDVACGTGKWLLAVYDREAIPAGIDLSERAIRVCKVVMPNGDFCLGNGEELPFGSAEFDLVSCLGALEHFIDPELALKDMVRVAKEDGRFLLLVPNAGFLTRRLGFYRGTEQIAVKEDVLTLQGWQELFEAAGLRILERWSDLHVLSWSWITAGPWYGIPLRAAQAFALAVWPLSWQYQVYHLCQKRKD